MGNIISSWFSDDASEGSKGFNYEQFLIDTQRKQQEEYNRRLLQVCESLHAIQHVPISRQQQIPEKPLPSVKITWQEVFRDRLVTRLLAKTNYSNWEDRLKWGYEQSAYKLLPIEESTIEHINIKNLFTTTNRKYFKITEIKQIINPYLMAQYQLMKERYRQLYFQVSEKMLFHGTRKQNLDNICNYNFDWRLHGRALGNRFGKGVSFTPIANYATHYGDKSFDKVMILSCVLVSNSCVGTSFTDLPPDGYDTTTNDNGQVVVKYEDNTFCPCYLIYYEGFEPKVPKRTR